MNTAEIEYLGNLRTQAVHLKSGEKIISDAPTDNHGKGESFSPTDLLSTSLVSCMITVMGISAEKRGIKMENVKATLKKTMTSNPRRVSKLSVEMTIEEEWTDQQKILLERVARNCPVAKSLNDEIEQEIVFKYI